MDVNNHHLSQEIMDAINSIKEGIQVNKLETGTKLFVETRNSVYELVILDEDRKVSVTGGNLVDGGVRYEEPVELFLTGSTWGSSMLKLDWLGKDMCMELCYEDRVLTTSPVKNVEIEASDGSWSYSLGWNNEDQD